MTDHGTLCTSKCVQGAVSSPLSRTRPPDVPCAHCNAPAGVARYVRGRPRKPLQVFGRFHLSRLELAA